MTFYAHVVYVRGHINTPHHIYMVCAKHDDDRLMNLTIVSKNPDRNYRTTHNMIEQTKQKNNEQYRRVCLLIVQFCVWLCIR